MNRLAPLYLFILSTIGVCGCQLPNSNESLQKNNDTAGGGQRFIITAHDCNMQPELDSITYDQLIGSWVDSLIWFPSDSCFVGARPVDRIMHLEFYPGKRYKLWETYSDTTKNYTEEGEYWTYYKNDSSAMVLAEWYGDTPMQNGDTAIVREMLLYSLSDVKLRMRSRYHQNISPEVQEMKRIK